MEENLTGLSRYIPKDGICQRLGCSIKTGLVNARLGLDIKNDDGSMLLMPVAMEKQRKAMGMIRQVYFRSVKSGQKCQFYNCDFVHDPKNNKNVSRAYFLKFPVPFDYNDYGYDDYDYFCFNHSDMMKSLMAFGRLQEEYANIADSTKVTLEQLQAIDNYTNSFILDISLLCNSEKRARKNVLVSESSLLIRAKEWSENIDKLPAKSQLAILQDVLGPNPLDKFPTVSRKKRWSVIHHFQHLYSHGVSKREIQQLINRLPNRQPADEVNYRR
eukprot:Awhi_evm1s14015